MHGNSGGSHNTYTEHPLPWTTRSVFVMQQCRPSRRQPTPRHTVFVMEPKTCFGALSTASLLISVYMRRVIHHTVGRDGSLDAKAPSCASPALPFLYRERSSTLGKGDGIDPGEKRAREHAVVPTPSQGPREPPAPPSPPSELPLSTNNNARGSRQFCGESRNVLRVRYSPKIFGTENVVGGM